MILQTSHFSPTPDRHQAPVPGRHRVFYLVSKWIRIRIILSSDGSEAREGIEKGLKKIKSDLNQVSSVFPINQWNYSRRDVRAAVRVNKWVLDIRIMPHFKLQEYTWIRKKEKRRCDICLHEVSWKNDQPVLSNQSRRRLEVDRELES